MATLTADITRDDTMLAISASLGVPPPFDVQIDSELMAVSSASDSRLSVRRGAYGTARTPHSSGATVYQAVPAVQTGAPAAPPTGGFSADLSALSAGLAAVEASLAEVFYEYDFAVDGGVAGTIPLRVGLPLPAKTYVNSAFLQIITPFTSGGLATVALTTGQGAGDIDASAAFDDTKYGAGMHQLAVHSLMTASRAPAIVVAVADLTAGKFKILFDTSNGWS